VESVGREPGIHAPVSTQVDPLITQHIDARTLSDDRIVREGSVPWRSNRQGPFRSSFGLDFAAFLPLASVEPMHSPWGLPRLISLSELRAMSG
jgi:hypothetical protein